MTEKIDLVLAPNAKKRNASLGSDKADTVPKKPFKACRGKPTEGTVSEYPIISNT